MSKELKQVEVVAPSANTLTLAYTVPLGGMSLANILITNEDMADARFSVMIVNAGKSISLASSQLLPGRTSFETSKFSLESEDEIHVKSTNDVTHFIITSMNQSEI
jgi:hypothetical protein